MKPPTAAPVYVAFYVRLAEIAHRHGYALASHGSLQRDLDLVAVPWTEDCSSRAELIEAVHDYAAQVMIHTFGSQFEYDPGEIAEKPHGRVAIAIVVGNGAVVDLSVMPRSTDSRPIAAQDRPQQSLPDAQLPARQGQPPRYARHSE